MKNSLLFVFLTIFRGLTAFCSPAIHSSPADVTQLVTNLYIVTPTGSTVLMDGTLTQYAPDYSNDLNGQDARKMTNPGENWGMLRNHAVYVVERRHSIEVSDSIFFKMWNMRIITYRLEIISSNLNFPGRTGILEDHYLNTSTQVDLSGTTLVNFSVTADPASRATDRFRLIFANNTTKGLLPFDFTFTNAMRKNNFVNIAWQTENTTQIKTFNVQRSVDGIHFQNTTTVDAATSALNEYQFTDEQPTAGDNYYRIDAVSASGSEKYSEVMKVNIASDLQNISVFPNPASANNLNLKMTNQPAGTYMIRLLNSFGQSLIVKEMQYRGGTSVEKIQPSQSVPPGIYQLEIKSPDGNRKVISLVF